MSMLRHTTPGGPDSDKHSVLRAVLSTVSQDALNEVTVEDPKIRSRFTQAVKHAEEQEFVKRTQEMAEQIISKRFEESMINGRQPISMPVPLVTATQSPRAEPESKAPEPKFSESSEPDEEQKEPEQDLLLAPPVVEEPPSPAPAAVPSIAELAAKSGLNAKALAGAFEMSDAEIATQQNKVDNNSPNMDDLMKAYNTMKKLEALSQEPTVPEPKQDTQPEPEQLAPEPKLVPEPKHDTPCDPSPQPETTEESMEAMLFKAFGKDFDLAKALELGLIKPPKVKQAEEFLQDKDLESIPEDRPRGESEISEPLLAEFPADGSVVAESVMSLEPTAPPQSPFYRPPLGKLVVPPPPLPSKMGPPQPKYKIGQKVTVKFIGEVDTIKAVLANGMCEPRYALENCGGGVLESMLEPVEDGRPPLSQVPSPKYPSMQAPAGPSYPQLSNGEWQQYPQRSSHLKYPQGYPAAPPRQPAQPQYPQGQPATPPRQPAQAQPAQEPRRAPKKSLQPQKRQFVPPKYARGQHVIVKCTGDRDIIVAVQGGAPECRYTLQRNGPNIVESMLEPVLVPKGAHRMAPAGAVRRPALAHRSVRRR